MSKKLIITADDYGYINLIDDAIVTAAANNRISAVSAFSNVPLAVLQAKIERLKIAKPDIPIGLHLTITSGSPLSNTNYLSEVQNGKVQFKRPKRISLKNIPKQEVKDEIQAQIERMKAVLGNEIDHLSCHHSILNLTTELFDIYEKMAKDNNIAIRSVRNCISLNQFSDLRALNPALIPPYVEDAFKVLNVTNIPIAIAAMKESNIRDQETNLRNNSIKTANYFLIHHYGNHGNDVFKTAYNAINDNEVCEQIMHLARAKFPADMVDFPNGINKAYLDDRNRESIQIMSNEYLALLNFQKNLPLPLELISYARV